MKIRLGVEGPGTAAVTVARGETRVSHAVLIPCGIPPSFVTAMYRSLTRKVPHLAIFSIVRVWTLKLGRESV